MFTVKRTTTSNIVNRDVDIEKYEYDKLSDAIDKLDSLKKEDKARYAVLKKKYPLIFTDASASETSYHFTFGKCLIECEILGVIQDAEKEFYIARQMEQGGIAWH